MTEAYPLQWPAPKKPWEVLGCSPDATHDEIDIAYRAMAKVWHPDKLGGSEVKMQELNEARNAMKDVK